MKQFDDHIREAFEGHEVSYNANAWKRLESALGGGKSGISGSLKIASVLAVITASGLGMVYLNNNEATIPAPQEIAQVSAASTEVEKPAELPVETKELQGEASADEQTVSENESILLEPKPEATQIAAVIPPKIKEPKLPKRILTISVEKACLGELIEFRVETNKLVIWEFGDGKVQHGQSVAHRYSQTGTFVAQASILDENDQSMEVLKSSEIKINEAPDPEFEFERPCDNAEASIVFDASNSESRNIWKLGDGSVLEGAHVEHQYEKMGFFKAKHIVQNEFGCMDSVTKRVAVCRAYNLLAPKSFDPSTEGWFPIGLKKGDVSFDLKILDPEAGAVAFQSTNSQDEWNGVVAHSGKKSKSGQSYLWIAVVTDTSGKISEYGGEIQIVDNE